MNRIDLQALTLAGPTGPSPVLDPQAVLGLGNEQYIISSSISILFYYRSSNPKVSLIVEQHGRTLKLFSAPNYHPSFQKGLHFANIVEILHGVNKVSFDISFIHNLRNAVTFLHIFIYRCTIT